jgi:hypothetical protein
VNALKKFAHFRKRPDLWKIFPSKQLGPVFIQVFAETFDLLRREKCRYILIGAFADLRAQSFWSELFPESPERAIPRIDVQFIGMDESAVDIEYESEHRC